MVSAGIQSKELLCGGAKNFNTSSYLLGLCYQTTCSFACNDLGLACQAYLGGSVLRIQEPKTGALRCCGLLSLVKSVHFGHVHS